MLYDEFSRGLILKFKHGDRLDPASAFAGWMRRSGSIILQDIDIICPVPLHWTRLLVRRYNQSAILARFIAAADQREFIPDLLVRTRRTPSQGALNRKDRARNVRGAFAVATRYLDEVAGKRILLVDDVLTTGATVDHCARTLRKAGALRVEVLTLARVALPDRAAV